MALNSLKVSVSRLEEGQWFNIAGIDWLVRGLNQELKERLNNIQKVKRKNASEDLAAFNSFVFKELVKDFSGLTEEKLQSLSKNGTQYVVNDTLNKTSGWFTVEDIRFELKRMTSLDVAEISKCSTNAAKTRKIVQLMIKDWENLKYDDEDVEFVEFSKKTSLDIFCNEEYRPVLEALQEIAYNPIRFVDVVSDEEITYSEAVVDSLLVNSDKNELATEIFTQSLDKDSYRADLIEKDIEMAKK